MEKTILADRARALARVRALAAKTTANGCTEAEAQAAAATLSRLMQDYEITLDEATVRTTEIVERIIPGKRSSLATHATWGISEFASTDCVLSNDDVHIFGAAPNTEIAAYLFLLCDHAIERGTALLATEVNADDRKTFGLGMAHRLGNRLADMAKSRAQEVQSITGTDLVVLGRAAAIAAVKERYGELSPAPRNDDIERRRNADIYRVGWEAAGDVAINAALNTDHRAYGQIEDEARRQQQTEEEVLRKAEKILEERRRKAQAEAARQAAAEAEERRRKTTEQAARNAAAAAARERQRKAEEEVAIQRLREDIETKLREEEQDWQESLRRREAAARSAKRLDRLSMITISAIGLVVVVYAVASHLPLVWPQ
jgi:hypothetical protein